MRKIILILIIGIIFCEVVSSVEIRPIEFEGATYYNKTGTFSFSSLSNINDSNFNTFLQPTFPTTYTGTHRAWYKMGYSIFNLSNINASGITIKLAYNTTTLGNPSSTGDYFTYSLCAYNYSSSSYYLATTGGTIYGISLENGTHNFSFSTGLKTYRDRYSGLIRIAPGAYQGDPSILYCGLDGVNNFLTPIAGTYNYSYGISEIWLEYNVDNTAPSINVTNVNNGSNIITQAPWGSYQFTVNNSENYTLDLCWYSLNDSTNTTYTCTNNQGSTATIYNFSSGWNNIMFYAMNDVGLITQTRLTVNMSLQAQYNFTNSLTGALIYPTCSVTYGTLTPSYVYYPSDEETETIDCTLTGYNTLSQSYSVSDGNKNFQMTPASLSLNFYLYNGTRLDTNGYWTDSNRTQNFSANNLTIATTDLLEGTTHVYFGYNNSLFNFTQFYDFENSWVSSTTENLTIMTDTTVLNQIYIKVIDLNSNPLDDVLVRVAISNPATGGVYKEIGQRFTAGEGTNGLTYFYVPSNTDVSIRITKDGYTAKTVLRNVLSNEYTSSNPLTVKLERSANIVNRGVFVMLPEYYNENITSITMQVYAPSRDSVTFATSHYPTTNYTVTLNEYKQGSYTLIRGIHYCSNCTDAISFTFWVDGEVISLNSVPYIGFDPLGKFNVDTGLFTDSSTGNSLLAQMAWIGIIILSGIIGIALRDQFEAQGIAKNIFMGLCLIISIIFVNELYFLGIVVGFYIIGMIVRKVYSE